MQMLRFLLSLAVLALVAGTYVRQQPARLHPYLHNFELGSRRVGAVAVDLENLADDIAKVADRVLRELNVTGMGVGVVYNHSVVFAGGFGFADKETKKPATGQTLFQIASNSKAFTSMLALMAQEKGVLPLDTPVSELIKSVGGTFAMNDTAATAIVTLRDMMSHRTGLPRHDAIAFGAQSRSQILEKLPYLALDKPPRYQPGEYNNIMFALTGLAEELALGDQWESLVTEHIFKPLNMHMTYANLSAARQSEHASNISSGYLFGEQVPHMDADVCAPAGAVVSCAEDMAKWVQLHLRQSAKVAAPSRAPPPGPMLVSPASYAQLLGSSSLMPGMYSSFSEYTMAWWRAPMYEDTSTGRMVTMLSHPGDLDGMASSVAFLPGEGHGVVVLTNAGASTGRDAMTLEIIDLLLGVADPTPSWTEACVQQQLNTIATIQQIAAALNFAVKHGKPPALPLSAYTGKFTTYEDAYGTAEIRLDADGHLRVCGDPFLYLVDSDPLGNHCGYLVPAFNETFAMMAVPDRSAISPAAQFLTFNPQAKSFWSVREVKVAPIVFSRV